MSAQSPGMKRGNVARIRKRGTETYGVNFNICNKLTCNVSASSSWDDDLNILSNLFANLEIRVGKMRNLRQDPAPVDGIDGAEVVFLHVRPVTENLLYWHVQFVRASID